MQHDCASGFRAHLRRFSVASESVYVGIHYGGNNAEHTQQEPKIDLGVPADF